MIDRHLIRELVSIPSHEDETAAGDRIADWLGAETDADVRRDDAPNGGNVIATRAPVDAAAGPTVAFVGHHDVVPPAESQVDGPAYAVSEREGRLYGRGAADMCGALGSAMCAFRDADPACELVFASFVGEEVGGIGARHAIEAGFDPDYAIVCEGSTGYSAPGVTDVGIGHKGRRGATITARGSAAHASEPDAGTNAIYRATEVIDELRTLPVPDAEVLGHHMAGSITVTGIAGGSADNVVPDRCDVTVDERTVPGGRAPLEQVEALPGVTVTIEQDLPPMACREPAFVDTVFEAAAAVQAPTPARIVKPHATDAGWLAAAGTACVVCGPAEPGEAHTATESVSWAVLERCYEIYRAAVTAM